MNYNVSYRKGEWIQGWDIFFPSTNQVFCSAVKYQ